MSALELNLENERFRLHPHATGRIFDSLKNSPFTLFAQNHAIFLLCSHGIDVLNEIVTIVSGLTSCTCAQGYFQDPKWQPKRERLTIAAMRSKNMTTESNERDTYFTWISSF